MAQAGRAGRFFFVAGRLVDQRSTWADQICQQSEIVDKFDIQIKNDVETSDWSTSSVEIFSTDEVGIKYWSVEPCDILQTKTGFKKKLFFTSLLKNFSTMDSDQMIVRAKLKRLEKRTSVVWDYFRQHLVDPQSIVCLPCWPVDVKEIPLSQLQPTTHSINTGTESLKRHLESKHGVLVPWAVVERPTKIHKLDEYLMSMEQR